jgi:hypothetical protein
MKAKAKIPEKRKSTESAIRLEQLEIERLPVTSGLYLIEEIMPFLGVGPAPDATDCEDMSLRTYRRAKALAEYIAYADEELQNAGKVVNPEESPTRWLADALGLQIELGRLTAKMLFTLYNDSFAAHSQKSA